MATQLKPVNLNTVGKLGYCLQYARSVFGVASKYPTAWDGWIGAKFKHQDQNFPNVAVLIWFDYTNSAGERQGHVAVRLGNGQIYSSPYQSNTTHAVLNSIAEVEQHYRAKYVGWSEDINGVKVIDLGADMVTQDQLNKICVGFTNLQPSANKSFQNNLGLDLDTVLTNFSSYKEHTDLLLRAQGYEDLEKKVTLLQAKVDELQTQLDKNVQVDEQTVVQNWFVRLWNNLFKKG